MTDVTKSGVSEMSTPIELLPEAEFDQLVGIWAEAEEPLSVPDIRAADFVGLPQERPLGHEQQAASDALLEHMRSASPGRHRRGRGQSSLVGSLSYIAAVAAGLALFTYGSWRVADFSSSALEEGSALPEEGWKAVSGTSATDIELQFSVERSVGASTLVEPGRSGAVYGSSDALILRVDLRGEASWVYLFEQGSGGGLTLLHPRGGAPWKLQPGQHVLSSPEGSALAYRPDRPMAGARYFALASSEPGDASALMKAVLEGGLERPDLWPRSVRALDSFSVDWVE